MKNNKPMLITMGDVNGVGPEICVRLLNYSLDQLPEAVYPCLIGSPLALHEACKSLKIELDFQVIETLDQWHPSKICVLNPLSEDPLIHPGQVSKDAGLASIKWVQNAVELLQSNKAFGMVTAPLSKESVELSVPGFQGHTEYIGEMCGDSEPVLALVHDDWVVAHVSTHVSLREACDRVQGPRLEKTTQLLGDLLQSRITRRPVQIGVAGLNPHAGENGLFGQEEIEVIQPFVDNFQQPGVEVTGPLPGDVIFPQLKSKRFDGVVAMYHDQGHVVTKTLAFELGEKRVLRGVNITLGLDIIRTSVDHGTGFDIAWKGLANEASLWDALNLAHQVTSD